MTTSPHSPTRPSEPNRPRRQALRLAAIAASACWFNPAAHSQISLPTAVDMALAHSGKVRVARADVAKARASIDQAVDSYIPVVVAGAGIGESYGYSFNPPTLFTFNAQSLLFNYSQKDYIRSARLGLTASDFALRDAREAVIEDTALTFLALQHDQQREAALGQQNEAAGRLVTIVEDRFNAGRDTAIDLTTARLTAAQLHLAALRAQDDTERDRDHLALALGLPPGPSLRADTNFPATPSTLPPEPLLGAPATPAVAAAYATAQARREGAIGDHRYLYRPQFSFIAQYNRYATFTNSFKQLQDINGTQIGANEGVFAVQIQVPLFDKGHAAKARESLADADHALAEADAAQMTALDGQLRLRHSLAVLQARTTVAELEQQLAQQQLDALTTQLNADSANPNGPALSPKDEQNSRIAEREKYLALIDANYQLHQAQINLLRQSGTIEQWLHEAATHPAP